MKLVFVTQVYDCQDAVLGFVPEWVLGLAAHAEHVMVLALEVGDVGELPANVEVRRIGRKGKVGRYLRYRRFLRSAFSELGYDALLAHMVPRYASFADRIVRKNGAGNFLWYTHKGVDSRLLRAISLVDKVFTASDESLRVDTPKKVVTGHGIHVEHFAGARSTEQREGPQLLAVGRLTPSKDALTTLQAVADLRSRGILATLKWIGAGLVDADVDYAREALHQSEVLGLTQHVEWMGSVPYRQIAPHYLDADFLVSSSRTGSVDKVVLEAMASRLPFIASGVAYAPLVTSLGERAADLAFAEGNSRALADRVQKLWEQGREARAALGDSLCEIVARDHEVNDLMGRLVKAMEKDS
ncbi:MAG: glycosyltransferase involved in cell wall biosynthesis [Planctomycetota bacterium]|jgi:glycosyltransferase involved in cell wall biosynthesis